PAGESFAGRTRNARLEVDAAGVVGMRLERIRVAVGNEARGFHGELRVHAEDNDVEEHLQVRLHLHIAAGRTEGQYALALAHREVGIRREAGPLSRRKHRWMTCVDPGLRAAR